MNKTLKIELNIELFNSLIKISKQYNISPSTFVRKLIINAIKNRK